MNMTLLAAAVSRLPEFQELIAAMEAGRCPVALSGVAAVHRTHVAAGIYLATKRPVVLVCADEAEADRMAHDLGAFLEQPVPVLTARSFTFHNATTVSRQWEHRRLALLSALKQGECNALVVTVEALLQRTMPPDVLRRCCVTLKTGDVQDLSQLTELLVASGYTRCAQVEGVGQFALRGGILDVYAPGMEQPARVEFFGDEVDAMGVFDPSTQRRTENLEELTLLPATEVLPHMAPNGISALGKQLQKLAAKATGKQNKELAATLEQDREALLQGRSLTAADRYFTLIYPELTTALDYIPADACILLSECSRVAERARTYEWQMNEDIQMLMERGELDGSCGTMIRTFPQLCDRLEDWAVAYLDSFTTATYPVLPRTLLSLMAKQLPTFGANVETAVQDLQHYQNYGFGTLLLVSGEQRALELQSLLREQKVKTAVEFQLKKLLENY